MASHTLALFRKWARYGPCADCEADPGRPCTRKTPATWRFRADPQYLTNPHRGRPRSTDKCGDTGNRGLRSNSTFACHLVPDHGGEFHVNWYAQVWRVRQQVPA